MKVSRLGVSLGMLSLAMSVEGCRRIDETGPSARVATGQGFKLVFTSNIDGEIEPCG